MTELEQMVASIGLLRDEAYNATKDGTTKAKLADLDANVKTALTDYPDEWAVYYEPAPKTADERLERLRDIWNRHWAQTH